MDELASSFESADHERGYFLDLETGELKLVLEDMDILEQEDDIRDIASNPERYARVPSIETGDAYQDMVDFLGTVHNERLRELLSLALDGSGAFKRFNDVLLSNPKEREAWFAFKDERMLERARQWLTEMGVDYFAA
jgi:hypothetical protein